LLWIRWFLIGPISSGFDDFDAVFQYCERVEGMGEKEVKNTGLKDHILNSFTFC